MNRRALVRELLRGREDAAGGSLLVIGGLGAPAWDITAAGDVPENLPLWGGMGGAAMMGLGLALAQPSRRVLVLTGDGEMLMGVGALATIAVQKPGNLSIVVLDNEHYGETGMQETAHPPRRRPRRHGARGGHRRLALHHRRPRTYRRCATPSTPARARSSRR